MKIIKIIIISIIFLSGSSILKAQSVLLPMDLNQTDHLKAYGITYWALEKGLTIDWLLNYQGGSFLIPYSDKLVAECRIRGVSFEKVSASKADEILNSVQAEGINQDVVRLEKAPKIAVYAPPGAQPWDDAVRLALEYAEVPHDIIWDEDVLTGKLDEYDWLHLHHEDFTGQYGKFWANYRNMPWYIQDVTLNENMAKKLGFKKVSQLKLAVAKTIKQYIQHGGFMFAMCSGTDTFDVALAAEGVDICEPMFDGDPADPAANQKLNYDKTLAFENFKVIMNPTVYEHSNIDIGPSMLNNEEADYFTLFEFSAKYDPVPSMLTQNHVNIVKGFLGQNTGFHEDKVKKSVIVMGKREGSDEVKYIHGNLGRGSWAWFGGHDPEDYRHAVGDPPSDLRLHRNSPGYRLILNNVLFPAAKKKKQKT